MTYLENDAEFRALALELLEDFGAPTVFQIRTGGSYSRATGTVSGGTVTDSASVLCTPPLPAEDLFGKGSTLVKGKSVVIVAADGFPIDPDMGIGFTHDGRKWTVVGRATLNSGAQAAAYVFGVESVR